MREGEDGRGLLWQHKIYDPRALWEALTLLTVILDRVHVEPSLHLSFLLGSFLTCHTKPVTEKFFFEWKSSRNINIAY